MEQLIFRNYTKCNSAEEKKKRIIALSIYQSINRSKPFSFCWHCCGTSRIRIRPHVGTVLIRTYTDTSPCRLQRQKINKFPFSLSPPSFYIFLLESSTNFVTFFDFRALIDRIGLSLIPTKRVRKGRWRWKKQTNADGTLDKFLFLISQSYFLIPTLIFAILLCRKWIAQLSNVRWTPWKPKSPWKGCRCPGRSPSKEDDFSSMLLHYVLMWRVFLTRTSFNL